MAKISPVLRWPGAKWTIASWIIENMPPHVHYVEPLLGSGAVFFKKYPSKFETINDLDGNIVNLFKVIRERGEELAELICFTPWSRQEYYNSYDQMGNELEDARRFLVRCWQAIGSKTSDRAGWRSDVQGLSGASRTTTWNRMPERIRAIIGRLKDAQIECQPAEKFIPRFAFPQVLMYVDPSYMIRTRSKRCYKKEFTDGQHEILLDMLDAHPGPVLLSGYANSLYDYRLSHWDRKTRLAVTESGQHREEVLWLNPVAVRALGSTKQA